MTVPRGGATPAPANPLVVFVVIGVLVWLALHQTQPVPITPPPIAATGLRVLITYAVADEATLPTSQQEILNSPTLRDWLDARCAKDASGHPEWRIWPLPIEVGDDQPIWRDAVALSRTSPQWIIVSDGRRGYSGPLPASVELTLALLEKYK